MPRNVAGMLENLKNEAIGRCRERIINTRKRQKDKDAATENICQNSGLASK
jgi:hypothetical protein